MSRGGHGFIDITGQVFGRLTAKYYDKEQGKWFCVCECGKEGFHRSGNLRTGGSRSCGCLKAENPGQPVRKVVGYVMAHRRVKNLKGYAKEHPCYFHSECKNDGLQWAYLGGDPDELLSTVQNKTYYSLNTDYYVPMCKTCHYSYDAKIRRERKLQSSS